jgi:hypothetical protein
LVKLLGFEQAIVSRIKILSLDVEACQGQALAGGFFELFVTGADFPQALTELDGTAVHLQSGAQAFYGAFWCLVLHKELGIEQGCFDFADVLGL